MKILFIYHSQINAWLGGLERVTSILSTEFKNKGHHVEYLILNDKKKSKYPDDFLSTYYKNTNSNLNNILTFLNRNNFDIIINQSPLTSTASLLSEIKKNIKIPVISVCHMQPFGIAGIEREYIKRLHPIAVKGQIIKLFGYLFPSIYGIFKRKKEAKNLKLFIDNSDKYCFLSEGFISRVINFCPKIDKSKLIAIPNPNTFNSVIKKSFIKENIIILVSRLTDPQKNISDFIKIWKKFQKKHPNWKCLIIGDGEHKKYLQKLAQKLKTSNLTFLGNVKDIGQYYSKAKILCLPSLYEGWGMVLTEAMAHNCVPVVYNSYESAIEIIQDKINGRLIPPLKKQLMLKALINLANNEDELNSLALNGPRGIQNFNASIIADKWIVEIEKII